ncbi:MAG: hypothetical protein H0T62_14340 [Parachlamydiaceae bacterium]|nr:hypothetical protein [Parachlamydiaceae bacterium]
MISSNDGKKFDFVIEVEKQQSVFDDTLQKSNLGKDSHSWEGRKVSIVSEIWNGLCNIIKSIFDKLTACFCCCSSGEQSMLMLDNDGDGAERKSVNILIDNDKDNFLDHKTNVVQVKADNGEVKNEVVSSEPSEDSGSDDCYEIRSDSSSDYDEIIDKNGNTIQKSAINELPKSPTSLTSATVRSVKQDYSSTKVNEAAKVILDENKINPDNIFTNQKKIKSSSKIEEKNIQEKFLDEVLNDYDYDYEEDELQDQTFENPLDQEQNVEVSGINLDDFYVSEDEVIEEKNVSQKVETKPQSSRFLADADSSNIISKKSARVNSGKSESIIAKPDDSTAKALLTLKKSLKVACAGIDQGETPKDCVRIFYASLGMEISKLSTEERLELICMLINLPSEINEEIQKAVAQSLWKDPNARASFDKSRIYNARTIEEETRELTKISAEKRDQLNKQRIESLKANFFGTEFSSFIGGEVQVHAKDFKAVQRIVGFIQDCGKHKDEKQIEMLSLIMTKLHIHLTQSDTKDFPYSFKTLQSYIFMLEDLYEVVSGSKIQSEPLQIDPLAYVDYSDDESESEEETVTTANSIQINPENLYENSHKRGKVSKAASEFQAKLSSLSLEAQAKLDYEEHKEKEKLKMEFNVSEKYHESAMNLLKAHAAIQCLTEFNFSKFDQKLFKATLQEVLGLISNINPSCEKYLKLQDICRESFGTYIFKDSKVSSLDSIEKLYSQIAQKIGLLSFKDFRELLGSEVFSKQRQALQHLREFDTEKNEVKLFGNLMKELSGLFVEISPLHPIYTKMCAAFNKIPEWYLQNYKELQNPALKDIEDCYDLLAKKFDHKTSQELEQLLNLQSNDSQKKYEVFALLKALCLETDLKTFEIKLTQIESSLGEITDSHFLYKPLKSAFSAILDKYMDILMTCNSKARDPDIIKKIKTSYDSLAKKLNLPCCFDPEFLLSPDFADKYAGLERLREYSESKMEVETFVEMLTDASIFIKKIDSKHPLFMPLRNAFDAIINRYDNYAVNTVESVKVKAPYRRLAQILGYKEIDMIVDTKEAEKEDTPMSNLANIEYLKEQQMDVLNRLNSLQFDYELTDTKAMAMVWKGYLESLLFDKWPRATAIGMLIVTFQKELRLSNIPKVWDKDMNLDGYLNAFSKVGNIQSLEISKNPAKFLNTVIKAGLSEVEAKELMYEITS